MSFVGWEQHIRMQKCSAFRHAREGDQASGSWRCLIVRLEGGSWKEHCSPNSAIYRVSIDCKVVEQWDGLESLYGSSSAAVGFVENLGQASSAGCCPRHKYSRDLCQV